MLISPGVLSQTVNLAYNLTVLQAHLEREPNSFVTRGVARRVAAETYETKGMAAAGVESLESWRESTFRHSLARFGDGSSVTSDVQTELSSEIARLKAVHPEVGIRLVERLFGVADAIYYQWTQKLLTALDDLGKLQSLQPWLRERLALFRALESEMKQGLSVDEDDLFLRYSSSFWKPLVGAEGVGYCLLENANSGKFPIPLNHELVQVALNSKGKRRKIFSNQYFVVTPSRQEFVYGLFTSLLFQAENPRWENGVLSFERSLQVHPKELTTTNDFRLMPWSPPADHIQLLSYQRVSGWKLGLDVVEDKVRVTIDFGKTLRREK